MLGIYQSPMTSRVLESLESKETIDWKFLPSKGIVTLLESLNQLKFLQKEEKK